ALAVAGAPAASAYPPPGDGGGDVPYSHQQGRPKSPIDFGPFEVPRRGDGTGAGLPFGVSGRQDR
uniref:hypothetical protein n=1 Tax=Streptomyces sp. CRN 30 TaxID=3075613 RepID=UPI002A82BDDC